MPQVPIWMGDSALKVIFKGVRESRVSGCSSCGSRRQMSGTFERTKKMILPSGMTRTFVAGRAETVSESDGQFLLDQTYIDRDSEIPMFEEVI